VPGTGPRFRSRSREHSSCHGSGTFSRNDTRRT